MQVHTSFTSVSEIRNPVVTIGTFDGVHLGHRSILQRLRAIADEIGGETVLLSFYPHPRIVLHPEDHNVQLLNTPEEKEELLKEAGLDHLIIYPFSLDVSRMSPFEYVRDFLVTNLHAHTVVVGYDHRFGRNREGDHFTLLELSETFGFRVEEIQPKLIDNNNVSSTKIRTALKSGKIREANRLLGYNYTLQGKVVHGDKIGRTIGYPTANIQLNYPLKLVPSIGVYSVHVYVAEIKYNGVMSIGVRPTVTDIAIVKIEVFILNFDRDIYEENLRIEILEFLREEKKFGSVDELKLEIANDVNNAQVWF